MYCSLRIQPPPSLPVPKGHFSCIRRLFLTRLGLFEYFWEGVKNWLFQKGWRYQRCQPLKIWNLEIFSSEHPPYYPAHPPKQNGCTNPPPPHSWHKIRAALELFSALLFNWLNVCPIRKSFILKCWQKRIFFGFRADGHFVCAWSNGDLLMGVSAVMRLLSACAAWFSRHFAESKRRENINNNGGLCGEMFFRNSVHLASLAEHRGCEKIKRRLSCLW